MPLDPDALLLGLRGRRLCLELATAIDHTTESPQARELHKVKFYAAHDLDPGGGASRVLFGAPESTPPPAHSAGDVAAALATVALPEPNDRALMRALEATVTSARYWQEPDGEDVLAAAPELRGPLARVAAHLSSSTHAQWWDHPLDRAAQWSVTFTDGPCRARTGDVAATLAQWRDRAVEEEQRARRERPQDPRAPFSGTWWSAPPFELPRSTRCLVGLGPVELWLVEDGLGWEAATVRQIAVPEHATVYEIERPEDWGALCRRYPLDVTASRRHDWYRTTGRSGRWVLPDWSRVAADFDAVHLTAAGYLTTSGRAVPVAENLATVLAGWTPDQTSWLVDVADRGTPEQAWTHDDEVGWIPDGNATSSAFRS